MPLLHNLKIFNMKYFKQLLIKFDKRKNLLNKLLIVIF